MADLRARYWHSLEDYRACIKALKLLIGVFVRGLKMTWFSQRWPQCPSRVHVSPCVLGLPSPGRGLKNDIDHAPLSLSLSLSFHLSLSIYRTMDISRNVCQVQAWK